jgi:hypothetical protein
VDNGSPIPRAILSFSTPQTYVGATINPDGSFEADLHAARHRIEVGGVPVGYSVASVRMGTADARELTVGNSDVSGIVVTITAPKTLPRVRGRVSGLPSSRLAETRVELTGPIVGEIEAQIKPDGSFDFPAVVRGLYTVRLPQVPEFPPMRLVVIDETDFQINVPAR